jgi:hypothetical protein
MTAKDTGAAERAHSMVQLLNGHSDVRESVEEVMQIIENDGLLAKDDTRFISYVDDGRDHSLSARACARYGVLVDGEEMKGSSGNVRRTVSDYAARCSGQGPRH